MSKWFINQEWIDDNGEDVIFSFEVPSEEWYNTIMAELKECKTNDEAYDLLEFYNKQFLEVRGKRKC